MFQSSPLFAANYNSQADVVVNQGGTSSGKTYSIIQVLFTLALQFSKQIITVAGQDIPNLKKGALRDAEEIWTKSPELQKLVAQYNRTDRYFKFHNGSIVEFNSYDGPQDAKSGKRDYLFINEANGISHNVYIELALRTRKKIFIDYNPNTEFWVHEKLIGQPGTELIISDHRHNPFLDQKVRDKIEALKTTDIELWKVYARGLTGKIEGLIFRNWSLCDEIPKEAKLIGHGLDFGFTNDPSTITSVYKQDGKLWLDEQLYRTEMTNSDIANFMKFIPISRHEVVVADSAEPKSIKEIQLAGFRIEAAQKGPDSIKQGIDILKRYQLMVTRRSTNLRKELNVYKWAVDRDGKSLNVPVDFANHCIDGIRYVALNKLNSSPSGKYATMNV